MFVKITKSGKYKYVQLVRSYRYDHNIKHQVLLNLGRLDQIKDNPSIQHLAVRLQEISNLKNQINMDDISDAQIVNWGYIVYQKLWQEFGLDKSLSKLTKKRKTQFNLDNTSFLMVIQHLLDAKSKLSTYSPSETLYRIKRGETATPLSLFRSIIGEQGNIRRRDILPKS